MSKANDNMRLEIESALDYLKDGGLGEVIGFTDLAIKMQEPKVQMDTDMAMALCLLASQALAKKAAH